MAKGEKRLKEIRKYVEEEVGRINPQYIRDYTLEVRPVTYPNSAMGPDYFGFYLVSREKPDQAIEVMQLSPRALDRKAESIKGSLAFSFLKNTLPRLMDDAKMIPKERVEDVGGLERSMVVLSGVSILLSILFLFPHITGNTLADLSLKTTSFLGASLLVVGLVTGFFWVKRKHLNIT